VNEDIVSQSRPQAMLFLEAEIMYSLSMAFLAYAASTYRHASPQLLVGLLTPKAFFGEAYCPADLVSVYFIHLF
jgi:hypothetical protein